MATKVSELRPRVIEFYNFSQTFVLPTPAGFQDDNDDDSDAGGCVGASDGASARDVGGSGASVEA